MCEAVSARGYYCTLPEGHTGAHAALVACRPMYAWTETALEDPQAAPSEVAT